MPKVKVCVLRSAGTNCDQETAFAFSKVDAEAQLVHINHLVSRRKNLGDYQILAIPGGFTYGDDLGAGKVFANELKFKLEDALRAFLAAGKLVIGICNGFQILVKNGLLPGGKGFTQEASLIINDSGKFEDRWVYLRNSKFKIQNSKNKCVWTEDLAEVIYLPVAHGEGKFIVKDNSVLENLKKNNQIVFQYCGEDGRFAGYPHNPNGSLEHIAGICDETGRILGLMPHPERHIEFTQHPRWGAMKKKNEGDGLQIFRNGVGYAKKYL